VLILAALALGLWLLLLVAPWQAWRCRERLEPDARRPRDDAGLTVLIPARDEAEVIGTTLSAVGRAARRVGEREGIDEFEEVDEGGQQPARPEAREARLGQHGDERVARARLAFEGVHHAGREADIGV